MKKVPVPISVVIPAFNAAASLAKTLASVYAQTVLPAEIIVFDDGSSDSTAAIAEGLGATVIRSPNIGSAAARNAAIRATCGEWIAFPQAAIS